MYIRRLITIFLYLKQYLRPKYIGHNMILEKEESFRNFFYLLFSSECNAAIHKKCIDKIIGRCTGTAANSRDTMVRIVYFCAALMYCELFPYDLALSILVVAAVVKYKGNYQSGSTSNPASFSWSTESVGKHDQRPDLDNACKWMIKHTRPPVVWIIHGE